MKKRSLTYFVADVHLGLDICDPAGRERRFVGFLRSIDPERTEALYMLGDIFDFWYEYRDVVPKGYSRVFAALLDLIEAGVKVYFFEGNHDVWAYSYFEELGMTRLRQPAVVEIGGKVFCLGHGDALGPVKGGVKFLHWMFHNRALQWLFSLLHPWIAFRIGVNWSKAGPHTDMKPYVFKGADEPLYKYAVELASRQAAAGRPVDCFIFGHYHVRVDMTLPAPEGARFMILKDWIDSSCHILFDGSDLQYVIEDL